MLRFALVAAFLLVVLASAQTPCEGPVAFEARTVRRDHRKHFSEHQHMAYDAINKRIARFDEIQVGRHRDRDFFAIVELFESKTRFTVNLKTKECNKTSIDYEFRRFGIPSNASFAGQAEIGTDAERNTGVLVDFWFIETDDIRWEGESTSSDCLPVSDLFEDRRLGAVHTSFYDIALGISDPNVFDVPKECQ